MGFLALFSTAKALGSGLQIRTMVAGGVQSISRYSTLLRHEDQSLERWLPEQQELLRLHVKLQIYCAVCFHRCDSLRRRLRGLLVQDGSSQTRIVGRPWCEGHLLEFRSVKDAKL
jgi:hypothetical protein